MHVTASAPTRIDLAGSTLDIWPLYLYHQGAQILNAAITLRAYCTISERQDDRLYIRSLDTGLSCELREPFELGHNSDFRLAALILQSLGGTNINLLTRSDSPIGAGIAGSSALNIAIHSSLAKWQGIEHSDEQLIRIAMNTEAQVIKVPTGIQDYYPAIYGGISAIELGSAGVHRVILDIDPVDIESRILLAYTGSSRHSSINNWEMIKRHIDGDRDVFEHFEKIRDIAINMRKALQRGDWGEVGHQIALEWDSRKHLAPQITTPEIEALIERAHAAGSAAAKVCGAGGGGCLLFFADPPAIPKVRRTLEDSGCLILDYKIDSRGVTLEVDK